MLKRILVVVVVVVLMFVGLVAVQPDRYHVERSEVLEASPAVVYDIAKDIRRFGEWSPWDEQDPNMKKTFSAATAGVGAFYTWSGNDQVGKGKMTITAVEPLKRVDLDLEFIEPFAAKAKVWYRLEPAGSATKFTWTIEGDHDFVSKAMSLFTSMDSMIGKDFEQGLTRLKAYAKTQAADPAVPQTATTTTAQGGSP